MKKPLLFLALLAFATSLPAQDNAAKLALAREAIAAMQADKMFDSMAAQMKQMATQMATLPAEATPEQKKRAEAAQSRMMDLSMEMAKQMVVRMDQVYADVYSEAELKAMKAFFTSPEGQSMIAKQPQVMTHMMPLVKEVQQTYLPQIQKIAEELKAGK